MNSNLYNKLRERIVRIVPEIMELKFGCKVESSDDWFYFVKDIGDGSYATSNGRYHGSILARQILGRDIQLTDVLRTMKCFGYYEVDTFGAFIRYENSVVVYDNPEWNLALPLHEQSDSLGEWLLTIIK